MLLPRPLSDPRLPTKLFGKGKQANTEQANLKDRTFSVPVQFQGKTVSRVELGPNPKEKAIALTFDDGPWPKTTEQVLGILKKNDIKATFFWVGRNLKNYPDIARQVVDNGHAIGNHTWHHRYFRTNPVAAALEVENTSALIYKTTGVKTSLFRPPGGYLNNGVAAYARHKNYAVMMWSVDPGENHRRNNAAMLAKNVLSTTRPGSIVLLHDIHPRTVQALPQIITGLKKQGYKFVTVPQLLAMQKPAPKVKPNSSKGKPGTSNPTPNLPKTNLLPQKQTNPAKPNESLPKSQVNLKKPQPNLVPQNGNPGTKKATP